LLDSTLREFLLTALPLHQIELLRISFRLPLVQQLRVLTAQIATNKLSQSHSLQKEAYS